LATWAGDPADGAYWVKLIEGLGTPARWAGATDEMLRPHALPGGCPNLLAAEAHDQIAEAYGPNASRLRTVKATFDPDGLFTAVPLPPVP
jgi:alpha-amylase/alpha-mannosidase (GH57 family)